MSFRSTDESLKVTNVAAALHTEWVSGKLGYLCLTQNSCKSERCGQNSYIYIILL